MPCTIKPSDSLNPALLSHPIAHQAKHLVAITTVTVQTTAVIILYTQYIFHIEITES